MTRARATAAKRVARAISDLIGDGCVVRLAEPELGVLPVLAVEHRDRSCREALAAALAGPMPPLGAGWAGQALTKNLAFRLRGAAATAALGAGEEVTGAPARAALVTPLRAGERPIGVAIAFRDDHPYGLHEQRRIEQLALLEDGAEEEHTENPEPGRERVLEHAGAGVWLTDLDGITTYANDTACALVGRPLSELLGTPLADYLDEEPTLIHARTGAGGERRDHRLLRSDGEELWVSMSSTPFSDERGRRCGAVTTFTDVSERKRLEVELRLRVAAHETVAELAEEAFAGEPLERLLESAAVATADVLGAEYATVCALERSRTHVAPRALVGWDRGLRGRSLTFPSNSPTGLCLDDAKPVVVHDYQLLNELEMGALARMASARSAVCIEIAGGAGVLGAVSPRAGAFADQDLAFLPTLTAVLASRWRRARPQLAALPEP